MGNHEYCINCGEDDFHYQRECNPAKVAAKRKEEAEREAERERRLEAALEILDHYNIPYANRRQHGYTEVSIDWYKLGEP